MSITRVAFVLLVVVTTTCQSQTTRGSTSGTCVGGCSEKETCRSGSCVCLSGFRRQTSDPRSDCLNIDECTESLARNESLCARNFDCVDGEGFFLCTCTKGLVAVAGGGYECSDERVSLQTSTQAARTLLSVPEVNQTDSVRMHVIFVSVNGGIPL